MSHVRKRIELALVISFAALLVCFALPVVASAAEQQTVPVRLPDFPVTLNGETINNQEREYPLIIYDGITYLPLTWHDCAFLGLQTSWNDETGLQISGAPAESGYVEVRADAANESSYTALVIEFPVQVNDRRVENREEMHPFLSFRNITYLPVTWNYIVDEFGWQFEFDTEKGLVLDSGKAGQLLKILVDGKEVLFEDVPPFIDDGNRVQVPLRVLADSLNCGISWDEEKSSIFLFYLNDAGTQAVCAEYIIGEKTVKLLEARGSGFLQTDDRAAFDRKAASLKQTETVTIDSAPLIVGDRTFIPARYLAEPLGHTVSWDEETQAVSIRIRNSFPAETGGGETDSESESGNRASSQRADLPDLPSTGLSSGFVGIRNGGCYYRQNTLPQSGGCVVTCLAMIASNLQGKEILPMDIYEYNGNGVYVYWSRVEPQALLDRQMKLDFNESKYRNYTWHDKLQEVIAALAKCPEGTMMSFISAGGSRHSVVVTGYDPDTGRLYVNDPAYGENVPLEESWTGSKMFRSEREALHYLVQIYAYQADTTTRSDRSGS